MGEPIENPILEHLKRFQAGQDRSDGKLEEVIHRLGQLETAVAGLRRDFAHADENSALFRVRLDRMNQRIERIERRLELS